MNICSVVEAVPFVHTFFGAFATFPTMLWLAFAVAATSPSLPPSRAKPAALAAESPPPPSPSPPPVPPPSLCAEAETICQAQSARLCTVAELEGSCTAGTGCGFDNHLIWAAPLPF